MTEFSDKKKYEILAKLSLIALYLVFGINVALAAVAYFIQGNVYMESGPDTVLIRNIFIVLALLELAALQFIKNVLLSRVPRITDAEDIPYHQLLSITYVIAGMCVSIAVYGFIIVLLGGNYDFMLLFVAISLIGFQLFRLRKKDLDKLGT
ncbi:MAG: hypothetical protein JSW64_05905 [Candidatus Zixiibacteriota bacterium]|nr:MAG: hypothetical protein JSW64_05905 [candidate division Zixibacteria bacterium]